MQKPFCDGCGRELQEGLPIVNLRASITPYTPGHSQEESAIVTENYNRDYHADCWMEREASFNAVIIEPERYFLAGDLAGIAAQVGGSKAQDSAPPAGAETKSDAASEEGSGAATAGNLGGDQPPILAPPVPPAEEAPEAGADKPLEEAPEDAAPEEAPTDAELSAESRGVGESEIPPGVNP